MRVMFGLNSYQAGVRFQGISNAVSSDEEAQNWPLLTIVSTWPTVLKALQALQSADPKAANELVLFALGYAFEVDPTQWALWKKYGFQEPDDSDINIPCMDTIVELTGGASPKFPFQHTRD